MQVGPPPCTVPPASPGALTFTTAGSAVSLAWGASPTAANYVLEAGQSTGTSNLANLPLGNTTSFSATAPLGAYFVRVRAVNACGVSAPSNEVVVTLDGSVALPHAPTGLVATVTGNAVLIRWTPPSSGGTPAAYRFEAGYSLGAANAAVVSTAVPGFSAAGVPAATYYVRVRALNAAGASPATADLVVTVP